MRISWPRASERLYQMWLGYEGVVVEVVETNIGAESYPLRPYTPNVRRSRRRDERGRSSLRTRENDLHNGRESQGETLESKGNPIQEDPNGQRLEVGCEGQGDSGVRFDRLNELRVGEDPCACGTLRSVPGPVEGCRKVEGFSTKGRGTQARENSRIILLWNSRSRTGVVVVEVGWKRRRPYGRRLGQGVLRGGVARRLACQAMRPQSVAGNVVDDEEPRQNSLAVRYDSGMTGRR